MFAAVDDFHGRRGKAKQFAVDQAVINHHVGAAQQLHSAQGE